jgi:diguanylate cyclase (GGDEF)-like protein
MDSNSDVTNNAIRLLSSIDLDEVAAIVADVLLQLSPYRALAVLMWDEDLERFGERFVFGPDKKDFLKVAESYADSYEQTEVEELQLEELDTEEIGSSLNKNLLPIHLCWIKNGQAVCACLLIAGEIENADEVEQHLGRYPLGLALHNAWQYRELSHENNRLRGQYEEIEDKTSVMEDQTRKLIHDITARDAMRTKQVERERLVYWISNAVRSSVQIREVLETTVNKIGTTIGVSRCLLLHAVTDELEIFEFTGPLTEPVRNLFLLEEGSAFAKIAFTRTSPHDLEDPDSDSQSDYDQNFLRKLGFRSGLIVPLVIRDRVLGVMFLQDCLQPREWSIDDVSLIGSLADNLAVAIENAELHQERERQAVTDGLTGIANRRSFNDNLSREFERARRYHESLSLIMVDLDHLKKINDTYGHQAGDEAIKTIGRVLKHSSRSIDLAARYGGEEFCLLLPNTELDMAEQLAERLRRLINEVSIDGVGNITASLGVASYPVHADNPDSLFQKADEALYVAKQAGRNNVKVARLPLESSDSHREELRN